MPCVPSLTRRVGIGTFLSAARPILTHGGVHVLLNHRRSRRGNQRVMIRSSSAEPNHRPGCVARLFDVLADAVRKIIDRCPDKRKFKCPIKRPRSYRKKTACKWHSPSPSSISSGSKSSIWSPAGRRRGSAIATTFASQRESCMAVSLPR